MAKVDIPIPESLREALSAPKCIDLSLPKPKKLSVSLPSGAALTSLANAGQNVPNDCSMTFSLMLQIAPLMASMDCLLKILKLLKPLSDAVTSPPPTPGLIKDIVEAVADLAPCFMMLTPAGMIPFVRDILCLVLAVLKCLIGQLKTLLSFMSGLVISLQAAEAGDKPNPELVASLKCAQSNALTSLSHLTNGLGPVQAILDLAAPFMSIAGVDAIQLPNLAAAEDLQTAKDAVTKLEEVVSTIQQVVDALGGCPS
ncbi:MAG: hypothetical protein R3C53_06890 [Pirellulaceae bacterium]